MAITKYYIFFVAVTVSEKKFVEVEHVPAWPQFTIK